MSLSKLLECCVCFNEVDTEAHRPKVLSCLHWICVKCLPLLITNDRITCPECRTSTNVPNGDIDSLQTDFRILQLKDIIFTSQDKEAVPVTCFNDGNPAEIKCCDCDAAMCAPCHYVHQKRKRFKSHKCIVLDKAVCGTHNREFVYICTKCPRFLCKYCLVTQCVEHDDDILTIDEVAPGAKTELETLISNIKQSIHAIEVQPGMKELDKNITDTIRLKAHVEEHRQTILDKVQHHFSSILDNVENRHQMLLTHKCFLGKHTAQLKDLLEIAAPVQSKCTEEIILATHLIKPKYNVMLQTCEKSYDMTLEKSLKFVPECSIDVGHLILITPKVRELKDIASLLNDTSEDIDIPMTDEQIKDQSIQQSSMEESAPADEIKVRVYVNGTCEEIIVAGMDPHVELNQQIIEEILDHSSIAQQAVGEVMLEVGDDCYVCQRSGQGAEQNDEMQDRDDVSPTEFEEVVIDKSMDLRALVAKESDSGQDVYEGIKSGLLAMPPHKKRGRPPGPNKIKPVSKQLQRTISLKSHPMQHTPQIVTTVSPQKRKITPVIKKRVVNDAVPAEIINPKRRKLCIK